MNVEELLRSVCGVWERQITLCQEAKATHFGNTANELWGFMSKGYRDLYMQKGDSQQFSNMQDPFYKARINKSAEFSSLMSAYVLTQIPHRNVTPRRPPLSTELAQLVPKAAELRQQIDAHDKTASYLMQWWLNYASTEYNLKREASTALPEAFVKGRGILWHELVPAPAGDIPASQFMSVDDLLIDGDTRQLRDAGFIIRERNRSVWQVSEETHIPREQLRSLARESSNINKATNSEENKHEKDICRYYEVYSRMGLGHWLDGNESNLETIGSALDELGHHVYLEILPGLKHPMNVNSAALTGEEGVEEMKRRLQWPIPFYADMASNPWPMSVLDFYPGQKIPWPTSPLAPGLPMQIFLDHLYCFVMSRIRVSSRNLLVMASELAQAVKDAVKVGFDLEVAEMDGVPGEELDKLMKFVEFPELNKDLWRIVALVERAFERATGLEPLLYGSQGQTQIRSAQEAGIREAHASSRPDDYADAVEDWLSEAGAKEGLATRLFVNGHTVAPLFGERAPESEEEGYGPLTDQWVRLITTDDEYQAASEFSYTVAAGQARRKNRQKETADFQQVIQNLGQPLVQMGMAGVPGPFNALVEMLGETIQVPLNRMMIPEGLQIAPEQTRAESQETTAEIKAETEQAKAEMQAKQKAK